MAVHVTIAINFRTHDIVSYSVIAVKGTVRMTIKMLLICLFCSQPV